MKAEELKNIQKSEYKRRLIRDSIIISFIFGFLLFLYIEIRTPLPVRILFSSVLQDVKSSILEEYSKVYYPIHYFSMQMTPILSVVNEVPDAYRTLVTNFFPKHPFIEEASMRAGDKFFRVVKNMDSNGYIVTENNFPKVFENTIAFEYKDIPNEELTTYSFYVKQNNLYINLVYVAKNDVYFSYNAKFDVEKLKTNDINIKDIHAYIATEKNLIVFPIADISKDVPENYLAIAGMLKNSFSVDDDMKRVEYNGHRYWGYRGNLSVAGNKSEIGIIVPEIALIKNIRLPIFVFFIIVTVAALFILIIMVLHYIKLISRMSVYENNIKSLISKGENTYIEFKSTLRYDTQTEKVNKGLEDVVMKSIAAFSNTEGGRLLIGINNDGYILGIENDYSTLKHPTRDFFELHIRTLVETYYGNAFSSENLRIYFVNEDDKDICIINVKKGNEPVYTKVVNKQGVQEEKFYIRTGNSSREISYTSEIIAYVKKHFRLK